MSWLHKNSLFNTSLIPKRIHTDNTITYELSNTENDLEFERVFSSGFICTESNDLCKRCGVTAHNLIKELFGSDKGELYLDIHHNRFPATNKITLDELWDKRTENMLIFYIREMGCRGTTHVFSVFDKYLIQSFIHEYTLSDWKKQTCEYVGKEPGSFKVDVDKFKLLLGGIVNHTGMKDMTDDLLHKLKTAFLCNTVDVKLDRSNEALGKINAYVISKRGRVTGYQLIPSLPIT